MNTPDIQLYEEGLLLSKEVFNHSTPFKLYENCYVYATTELGRSKYAALSTLLAYIDQEESVPGSTYLNSDKFRQMVLTLHGCLFWLYIPGRPELLYIAFTDSGVQEDPEDDVHPFVEGAVIGWNVKNQRAGQPPAFNADTHVWLEAVED